MISLAAVSAVLQHRTREYLELNLDGNFPGDIQKAVILFLERWKFVGF